MYSDCQMSGVIKKSMHATKSTPNPQKTLKAFQQKCLKARKDYFETVKRAEAKKAEYFDTYSERIAKEKAVDIDADTYNALAKAQAELKIDLAEIIDGKLERFRQVALSAPSEEQIRMLQAIQMRADALTRAEVVNIAAMLADNHQALRSLAHLAQKSGITIVVPDTADDFGEDLQDTHNYLLAMVNSLGTPDNSLNFHAREFYLHSDSEQGLFHSICEAMDGTPYTVEQTKEPKTAREVLEYSEKTAIAEGDIDKAEKIRGIIEAEDLRKNPDRRTLINETIKLAESLLDDGSKSDKKSTADDEAE